MISVDSVGDMIGVKIEFGNAPILLIKAKKGFLGCGYFSVETANKIGDVLAVVRGVKIYEDMLRAEIVAVSEKAREIGIREGMRGEEALNIMNKE